MTTRKFIGYTLGSVLLAVGMYVVLAAPGFLTDEASTVSLRPRAASVYFSTEVGSHPISDFTR
jgi:hypothetical protein